jgi:hypothetical protein
MRRTVERKKRGRARLRAVTPPQDPEFWVSGSVCRGHFASSVQGRRRIRHILYMHFCPPLAHPEWGHEKIVTHK